MTHGEVVYMLTQMLIEQHDQSQDFNRQRGGTQKDLSINSVYKCLIAPSILAANGLAYVIPIKTE